MANPDSILRRLLGETHPWLEQDSPFFIAFSNALRTQLDYIDTLISEYQEYLDTGIPLRNLAESFLIFPANGASDAEVLGYIAQVFDIHEERGTQDGIEADITRLLNSAPTVAFKEDIQWYLGVTFPDQTDYVGAPSESAGDGDGTADDGNLNILCYGIDSAIIVQYTNDTHRTNNEIANIILRHFIPTRVVVDLQEQ